MSPTIYRPSPARRDFLRLRISIGIVALALVGMAASGVLEARPSNKARVVYGASKPLGKGLARVYMTLDENKKPASLGVSISEAAMNSLPMTPIPPSPSAATLMLELPKEAKATGFDHVMVDWNPAGHEPD